MPIGGAKKAMTEAASVLADIRQIIRASDVFSKKLHRATGLTTAQALTLKAIADAGEVTTKTLSTMVAISQATLTSVLDRLEAKALIERYRSTRDRRVVHAKLTDAGEAFVADMPNLLDEHFIARFAQLPATRRKEISSALSEAAMMMNADASDAAPAVNGRSSASVKRA
ncbi:MAG: MarR family transcriptional regulator [Pseudomonadota bacterium]